MRKNIWIGALGMIALLLSACSAESEDITVQMEAIEPAAAPDNTEANENGASFSDESPDAYREIYRQVVTEKEGDALSFSLVYLDDDDLPELVVWDRGYESYSIYTVKDGREFCMVDAMIAVEMGYFERKGVISQFARWNGGGDEGGYGRYYYQVSADKTLANSDLPNLHYAYDATYDGEGNWTGDGVTKYYHMDQEIDETTYQQMMNGLGIIEGEEKSFADQAFGKTEMLDQLGKPEAEELDASASLTDEEKLLNERMEYYRKSAYYDEVISYWEGVREVTDVSNRIEMLYDSDSLYLTGEILSLDPPVIIHLAKNEIYARHGYIFKDPDLYNYFMGCIWYTPTTAPEDFSEEVFNEYEKENLKLLEEFDSANEAYYSVLEKLYTTYTLPDGTELGYDGITDLSWNKFAIYDIDQDGKEELIVLWITTYTAGMSGIVYGYDSASGTVKAELFEYPSQTFYDNGVVKAELSHNHGMAGEIEDFWPYTLYRYDKDSDTYVVAAEVDAWNKAYYETDYNDNPFPDELDVDGDGILYQVIAGEDEKLIDLEEYKKWCESVIGGAQKVEIPFVEMTEGNLKMK